MTLEQSQKIQMAWGKFLEVTYGKLMMFFWSNIPESFLPYPKKEIECALNIVAEHYWNQGNKEAVNTIQSTIPCLMGFVDDKKAIDKVLIKLNNPTLRDRIIKGLQELNKKQSIK